MTSAKVTSKGQITIPAEVRNRLGLRPGSRLTFVALADGGYELRAGTGSVRDLKGVVAREGRPVSLDDMDAAIAAGANDSTT